MTTINIHKVKAWKYGVIQKIKRSEGGKGYFYVQRIFIAYGKNKESSTEITLMADKKEDLVNESVY